MRRFVDEKIITAGQKGPCGTSFRKGKPTVKPSFGSTFKHTLIKVLWKSDLLTADGNRSSSEFTTFVLLLHC